MNTTLNIYMFTLTLRYVKLMKKLISFFEVIKSKNPPIKWILIAGQIFVKEPEKVTFVK